MGNETSKTRAIWGELEWSILNSGRGIDIGCGPDPVSNTAQKFDVDDGDANKITDYVHEQFDFVYSSHCLEHMHDPVAALHKWWKLVKPGGHLFLIVPDEDLYEMGVFPSRFNPDHKATFTIAKTRSWSPVSVNLLDLAKSLPNSHLIDIRVQCDEYDVALNISRQPNPKLWMRKLWGLYRRVPIHFRALDLLRNHYIPADQTQGDALAQIQCLVRKLFH